MTVDKEFEAFRAMMLSQFARLAENAGRYVGRMSNAYRSGLLELALDFAYLNIDNFHPGECQLAKYWDVCLREVISWQPRVLLRRTADWETVPSDVFLTRIPPVGVPEQ